MSSPKPPNKGFDLYYSAVGDGTSADPVVMGLNFLRTSPSLEELRAALPDTVIVEPTELGGFEMKGVDPAMTRVEILGVFGKLMKDKHWTGKHMA